MYYSITVFKHAGMNNELLVVEGTENICVSLISPYSDTRAFQPVSCSSGLHSKDIMSFGYLFSGVQGVLPKRGKIPSVILDLLQSLESPTMYFLNCALTLLTDTYSILSEPGSLLCPTERQPLLALKTPSMPISPPHGHHAFF